MRFSLPGQTVRQGGRKTKNGGCIDRTQDLQAIGFAHFFVPVPIVPVQVPPPQFFSMGVCGSDVPTPP